MIMTPNDSEEMESRTQRLISKLRPATTALVLVDVQNDFCTPDGVMHREGADLAPIEAMLPHLESLLAAARAGGVFVVHVRNSYSTEDNRYLADSFLDVATRRLAGRALITMPMCETGTWGADAAPGFESRDSEAVVIKHRYSGFHQTELEMLLRVRKIETVVPCGVATNVCVESTARDAFMRDFHVVFPRDASATYYPAAHAATLSTIGLHFGELSDVAEISGLWQSAGSPSTRVMASGAGV